MNWQPLPIASSFLVSSLQTHFRSFKGNDIILILLLLFFLAVVFFVFICETLWLRDEDFDDRNQDANVKEMWFVFIREESGRQRSAFHFKIVTLYCVSAIPVFISFVMEPNLVQNVTFYTSRISQAAIVNRIVQRVYIIVNNDEIKWIHVIMSGIFDKP